MRFFLYNRRKALRKRKLIVKEQFLAREMLEIRALGNLSVLKNGKILDNFGSSKAEATLAYLVLEGGQQSRIGLAALFWPESSEQKAHASLRVVLSSLRKYVGEYIEITRETVRIKQGPEVFLDVHDFEEKIAGGNLPQALELYRGDLLQGLHIQDSNEFENWRRWEQERLHILLIDALQVSIADELTQGNYKNGQNLASELLKIDPLNEIASQQYMIALALDGKRTDALKHYKHFSEILMDELGLKPSLETENMKNLISQGDLGVLSQQIMPKNNLPYLKTSFIGREEESAHVFNLLKDESCRLLTLTGPGGVGKTRLALNVARKVLNLFADGVFFITLERVPSPDFLIPAIAESLQFDFDRVALHWESRSQLITYLSSRSILLILDGYEHLTEGSDFLSELLQQAARLKLLVTSRHKLNIQGEWAQQVSGLPVPDNWENAESEFGSSLDLFIERARQANPTLNLSGEELNAALQICQLVEGFPLGIELATSWTALLSCAEIAEEISKSFSFLTSQMLDVSEKHSSLEATFNYSWQMLEKDEREVLARLSVFRGGFTHQAAKGIAGATWMNLTSLLNKSLVHRTSDGRIDLHKMILHFTEEKLKENPEVAKEVYDKHSRYYIELLREREVDLNSENMTVTREEIRPEIENFRAAVNWAVLNWDMDAATEAVRAYFAFYLVHGWHDGVIAFDQLASLIQMNRNVSVLDNPAYLSCRAHQAWFCSNLGMVEECEKISEEGLQPLIDREMDRELAICLHNLGVSAEFRGDFELSKRLLEQAIELGAQSPFFVFPSFYLWLGYVHFLLGDYDDGMRSFKISYALFNEDRNTWGASFALSKMGLASDGLGDHAAAMEFFREAYVIFLDSGDLTGQGYSLSRMSMGAYFLEDYKTAIGFGEQALELFTGIGHRWGICISLGHLGFANLGMGRIQKAKTYFYDALKLSSDSLMAPLSLYALAGIACTFLLEEEEKEGIELFKYVQSHPKTPALYIDMARRWFQNQDCFFPQEKWEEDMLAPLTNIVEGVQEKAPADR
jgi:predicted ATPase/DNA-binding SARP family transcriptional activator